MPTDEEKKHAHAHDHEHSSDEEEVEDMGEDMDDEDDGVVILQTAEGDEMAFHVLEVIDVDDEQFALLTPANDDEGEDNDEEAAEIYIFHYEVDEDGAESFTPVEDEDTFAKVREAAEALFTGEDDS
jgi:uncharacterized protein YrzB (UPF0473 family)